MQKYIFQNFKYFFLREEIQNMLGYWPYAINKNIFYIFFAKNTNITVNPN
jgi:hypothetical protein